MGLVLVSLLLILVLPSVLQRRVDALRTDINGLADPARSRLAEIRTELAFEAAGRRGYLLTGDTLLARDVAGSRERRRLAEAELDSLATALGGEVGIHHAALRRGLLAVDAHLDSVLAAGWSRTAYVAAMPEQRGRFDAALEAADRLQQALVERAGARRRAIRTTERATRLATAALSLVALAAAALVARLGRNYRALALRLEQTLEDSEARRAELERVTESRTRLIRGFTHDVKNPLGAADGYLALLEEGIYGPLAVPQHERVGKVRRSIRVALDLIAQLLDLARAESGELALRRERLDPRETVRDVVEEFAAQARAKALHLALAPSPDDVPALWSDAGRVRQVFANLVSNAVKYTPEGGRVAACVRRRDGAPAPGPGEWVALEVSDTGRGIPAEQQALLFREFTRFDPGAAQGSGIGLAISQRLATALGGRITVRSVVGEGSTFTLWLPVRDEA